MKRFAYISPVLFICLILACQPDPEHPSVEADTLCSITQSPSLSLLPCIKIILIENSARDNLQHILSRPAADWMSLNESGLLLNFIKQSIWLQLEIKNPYNAPAERYLSISNPLFHYFTVYQIDPITRATYRFEGGSLTKNSNSRLSWPHFRLLIPAEQTTIYYIRIKTTNRFRLPIQLLTSRMERNKRESHEFHLGVFVGIGSFLILLNIFVALVLRQRMFYLYLLICVTVGISQLSYQVLPRMGPEWLPKSFLQTFYAAMSPFALSLFFIFIYELRASKKTDRWISILLILGALSMLICSALFFINHSTGVMTMQLLSIPAFILIIMIAFYLWLGGQRQMFFVWLAFIPGPIFFAILLMKDSDFFLDLMKVLLYSRYSLLYTGLTLTLALLDRLSIMERRFTQELRTEVHTKTSALLNARNRAEKLLSRNKKIATISWHNLLSPLAALRANLNLLRSHSNISKADRNDLLDAMQTTVGRLVEFSDELKKDIQSEQDEYRLNLESYAIHNLCESVSAEYRNIARLKKIKIINKTDPAILWDMDANRMRRVLENLISNAIKFSRENGEITMRSLNTFTLEICDQGIGTNPQQLRDHINQEITQSKPGTAGEKGHGLGLAFCGEIISQHSGRLDIESTPGRGTCIKILWPPEKVNPA